MTKGTKIFRIIICTLLALTMLWSVFWGVALIFGGKHLVLTAGYDIVVAGVLVNKSNADDVLGDGKVYYDANNNILTFDNATIESDNWIVYSNVDLNIQLIGENKFICTNKDYSVGVYAGDYQVGKDLAFIGDGSLTIEIPNASGEAAGLFASELIITSDVTVKTPDCENKVHGIVCGTSLLVANKATVTVENGSGENSVGVRVRGNALFEEGTALNVSVKPGTTESCKGFSVSGDVFLGKDVALNVAIDDATTDLGECVRVSGLMEVGPGATVTASAKNAHAIECFGTIEANKGATISATSDKKAADIFCSGAVINSGAKIEGEIESLVGVHNKAEN